MKWTGIPRKNKWEFLVRFLEELVSLLEAVPQHTSRWRLVNTSGCFGYESRLGCMSVPYHFSLPTNSWHSFLPKSSVTPSFFIGQSLFESYLTHKILSIFLEKLGFLSSEITTLMIIPLQNQILLSNSFKKICRLNSNLDAVLLFPI